MIGDTGDFDIEEYVDDTQMQGEEVVSEFGNMYGVEDGWSEEMQGLGSFEGQLGYSVRHSMFRRPVRRGKPMHGVDFSIGELEHPMAGEAQMGAAFPKHLFKRPSHAAPTQAKVSHVAQPHRTMKRSRFGRPMHGVDFSMGEAQMGGYLDDLKAKLQAGVQQVKSQVSTQANTALTQAKADINKQLEAKKTEMVAQAKQTIQTQATNLINKAADTATAKLNQAIVSGAQSPAVQSAVAAGTTSAIDKALAYKDELIKKSKPAVIAAGAGIALFIAWKIYSARKAA
ncbi:MAG: hypothetical protein H7836_04405 [Magnetococcus sp. YQC-3]